MKTVVLDPLLIPCLKIIFLLLLLVPLVKNLVSIPAYFHIAQNNFLASLVFFSPYLDQWKCKS